MQHLSEVVVNKGHSLGCEAGFRTFLRRLLNTIIFNENSCHNMQMSYLIEQVDEPGQTELVDVIDVFHLTDTGVQGSGMNSNRPVTVTHAVNLPFGLLDALLFGEDLLRMKLFEKLNGINSID
jgi:hypothetical protein